MNYPSIYSSHAVIILVIVILVLLASLMAVGKLVDAFMGAPYRFVMKGYLYD